MVAEPHDATCTLAYLADDLGLGVADVEAPRDGPVTVAVQNGPVQLAPDEVERLRQALALARAVVIWDRGWW